MSSGLLFTSAMAMSWSERPGKTETLWTRVGFVVKKRSRLF